MASSEDLGKQFKIQEDINKVLLKRSGLYSNHTSELRTQLGLAKQLLKTMNKIKPPGADDINELNDSLEQAADSADKLGDELESAGNRGADAANNATNSSRGLFKNLSVGKTAALGFGVGLFSAFKGTTKILSSVASGVMSVVTSLGKLAFAIISTPFKILGGLIAEAGSKTGVSEIRVALNEIREQFGSLASNEGQMFASTVQDVRSQMQDLAGTGLRMARVYGYHREGVAAAMRSFMEIASALGPALHSMTDALKGNQVQLDMQRRGLGLTAEAFADVMSAARDMGKDPIDAMTRFSGVALSYSKQFGINVKTMSKGMAEITKDVENFGNMGVEEMARVTTYAQKLGVEIATLGKLSQKWMNFDDAAQSASMLSQAFGMNIDAMQMMQEQNPAKQAQMLKDAFDQTGRSVQNMTKQELQLLSTTMGLSAEEARRFLAGEANYNELGKEAESEIDVMKEQSKIMQEMADNIKRLTRQGTRQFSSFFDSISQGFSVGFKRTEEYRGLMIDMNRSLREGYKFGIKLGRMFMREFPGVQKMFKGLRDIFDPASFRKLFGELYDAFEDMFKMLRTDPKRGVENFIEAVKKAFKSFFGRSGDGVSMVKEGATAFLQAAGVLFRELFILAVRGLTMMFSVLNDWLENPVPSAEADKLRDAFMSLWSEIVRTLEMVMPQLLSAYGTMIKTAFKTFINSADGKEAAKYFTYFIGTKIILGATMSALKGGAAAKALKLIGGFFSKMSGTASIAAGKMGPTIPPGIAAKQASTAAELNAADKAVMASGGWKGAIAAAAKMALFITVGIAALAVGFLIAYGLLQGLDPATSMKVGLILVAMSVVVAALGFTAMALKNPGAQAASPKDLTTIAMLALLGAAMGLFTVGIMALMGLVQAPSMDTIIKFFLIQSFLILQTGLLAGLLIIMAGMINPVTIGTSLLVLAGLALIAVALAAFTTGFMIALNDLDVDTNKVSTLLGSMISMIWTLVGLIPILMILGVMMLPLVAGFGLIMLGFDALGEMADAMVDNLLPGIIRISEADIPDPAKTKLVVDMIIDVINSIAGFVGQLAGLVDALKPPPGAQPDQLEKNIAAVVELVEALVGKGRGIGHIIDLLVDLAKSPDITSQGLAAVSAISGALSAVSGITSVLQPNEAMMKNVADNIDNDDLDSFMWAMAKFVKSSGKALNKVIKTITDTFLSSEFMAAASNITQEGLSLISALGPVFESLGSIAMALQPNPAVLSAVASNIDNDDFPEFVDAMGKYSSRIGPQLVTILSTFGPVIGDIMQSVGKMLSDPAMRSVSAAKIESIVLMVGPIAEAIGAMSQGLGPIIAELIRQQTEFALYPNADRTNSVANSMTEIMDGFTNMFKSIIPSIKDLVIQLREVASGIDDPETATKQIEAVAGALSILGVLGDIFDPQDPSNPLSSRIFSNAGGYVELFDSSGRQISSLESVAINMNMLVTTLLNSGGPVHQLVQAMGNMPALSKDQIKSMCSVKIGLDVLMTMMSMMTQFQAFGAPGPDVPGDPNAATGAINSALVALHGVNWSRGDNSLASLLVKLSDNSIYGISKSRLKEVGNVMDAAVEGPLAAVGGLIERANQVKELLNNVGGNINLRADIQNLANAIGIDKETFTINNDPVQITINLDLKMDADQIATRLSRTSQYQTVKIN